MPALWLEALLPKVFLRKVLESQMLVFLRSPASRQVLQVLLQLVLLLLVLQQLALMIPKTLEGRWPVAFCRRIQ